MPQSRPRYGSGMEEAGSYGPPGERRPQQWHGDDVGGSRRGGSREYDAHPHQQWAAPAAAAADDDTSYYSRGIARGGGRGPDPRSAHYPPTSAESSWPDEISARSPRDGYRMMPPEGRGPAGGPPDHDRLRPDMRNRDGESYADSEDLVGAKRGRYGMAAAGRDSGEWAGQPPAPGYSNMPSLNPSSSKDEFEKEVMRQAAKMVAERELAARDEARLKHGDSWQRPQQELRQWNQDSWREDGANMPVSERRAPPPMLEDSREHEHARSERGRPSPTAGTARGGATDHGVSDRRQHARSVDDRNASMGSNNMGSSNRDAGHTSRERETRHGPPLQHQRDSRSRGEDDRDERRDGAKRVRPDASGERGTAGGSMPGRTPVGERSNSRSAASGASRRNDFRGTGSQHDEGARVKMEEVAEAAPMDDGRMRRRGDNSRERQGRSNLQKVSVRGDDRGRSLSNGSSIEARDKTNRADAERREKQAKSGKRGDDRGAAARQDSFRDGRDRSQEKNIKGKHSSDNSNTPRPLNPPSPRYADDGSGRQGKKRAANDWNQDEGGVKKSPAYANLGSPGSTELGQEHSTADVGWHVFVKGISISTTFTDLAKRFAAFGDVNGLKAVFNQVTCKTDRSARRGAGAGPAVVMASPGFAFISFDNEEGMNKAIEGMNDQVVDGNVLKVRRKPRHHNGLSKWWMVAKSLALRGAQLPAVCINPSKFEDHLSISSLCPTSLSHAEPILRVVPRRTVRDSLVAYNSSFMQRIAGKGSEIQHRQHTKAQCAASCELECS